MICVSYAEALARQPDAVMAHRRFSPPLSVGELEASFVMRNGEGQQTGLCLL